MKTCLAVLTLLLVTFHPLHADDITSGPIIGIGTELASVSREPTIVNVVPGAPADKAGVRNGDRLLRIDDLSVDGLSLVEISHRLRGTEGSPIRVTVQRYGHERTFDMKREILMLPGSPGSH